MNPPRSPVEEEVVAMLREIRRARLDPGGADRAAHRAAEERIEARFRPSVRLAVYGSLAPGEINHHVVAPLGGSWHAGFVHGEPVQGGWAAPLGYPAMRWIPDGPRLPVRLLVSEALAGDWARLDAFEGDAYRRILIPVFDDGGLLAIANIYEASVGPVPSGSR